jgi:hypothetical protein
MKEKTSTMITEKHSESECVLLYAKESKHVLAHKLSQPETKDPLNGRLSVPTIKLSGRPNKISLALPSNPPWSH